MREVAHLVRLRHAPERRSEFFAHEFTVAFVDHLEQRAADKLMTLKTEPLQGRGVTPFEIPVGIDRVDRFASTLENVVQQRLMLASDRLDLTQFGKIARGTDNSQRLARFIKHRLD